MKVNLCYGDYHHQHFKFEFPTLTPGELAVLDDRRPSCTFREGASMAPLLLA